MSCGWCVIADKERCARECVLANSAPAATTSPAPATGWANTPPEPSQAATEQIAPLPEGTGMFDFPCPGDKDPVSGTDKGYMEVLGELQALHIRKSATYGTEGERFHNFVALGEAAGKPPEYGAWMRIVEKGIRALNMIDAGLEDDVKEGPDVAGLGIIAEALRRRRLTD